MDDRHLNIQLPNFVYQQAPTLVPGGGAEVVPLANAQWFLHNGFTPTALDHSFFAPPVRPTDYHESTSSPFDFHEPVVDDQEYHQQPEQQPLPDLSIFLAPSPLGLPVYSASGFDILALLARIVHRPNPRVHLGPVDLTAAFCVVDTRRFDHPIVYCSRTFCTLTGYAEHEVLGRNCRFLQAPGGSVQKGAVRTHTSPEAVNLLRKSLLADKEVQTSIINYKKDGAAFVNLVTVIPVPPLDDGEVAYHVGFQVDLAEQPNAIMEKLRNGSYLVENDHSRPPPSASLAYADAGKRSAMQSARDRKTHAIPPIVMSKTLRRLLTDPSFTRSMPISYPVPQAAAAPASTTLTTTTALAAVDDVNNVVTLNPQHANHPLHLLLLEASPDFIHVVSLKGDFLYVAPSVRRALGYEAAEMQGKGLASYAHPEDVVPLMRELKEASAMGPTAGPNDDPTIGTTTTTTTTTNGGAGAKGPGAPPLPASQHPHPRPVDLLFRCRTKFGRYVWVEARGRLYVEPGKGRKAIILAGRAREMTCLRWADVGRAGGLAVGVPVRVGGGEPEARGAGGVEAAGGKGEMGTGTEDAAMGMGMGIDMGATIASTNLSTILPTPSSPPMRAQEAWGLLGGSCARTAVFAGVGRGMRDVLGWAPEDLVGRGVMRTVVLEEGLCVPQEEEDAEGENGSNNGNGNGNATGGAQGLVVRSIGAAMQSMRAAQRWLREQRRMRVAGHGHDAGSRASGAAAPAPSQPPVDLARVKKIACRLRTRGGGALDCWVVIYRADVDDADADAAEVMNGGRHGFEGAVDDTFQAGLGHGVAGLGHGVAGVGHGVAVRADAGASITPAALVFQIRVMGAERVAVPFRDGAVPEATLRALGVGVGVGVGVPSAHVSASTWKESSSSLAGAVGDPLGGRLPTSSSLSSLPISSSALSAAAVSSSSASSLPPATSSSVSDAPSAPALHAALTTGAGDVFAELAVARGSSWQYELQQLRITNARLKEELAGLEAAEAALGRGAGAGAGGGVKGKGVGVGVGGVGGVNGKATMVVQPQPPASPPPPPHVQDVQRLRRREQLVRDAQGQGHVQVQASGSTSTSASVSSSMPMSMPMSMSMSGAGYTQMPPMHAAMPPPKQNFVEYYQHHHHQQQQQQQLEHEHEHDMYASYEQTQPMGMDMDMDMDMNAQAEVDFAYSGVAGQQGGGGGGGYYTHAQVPPPLPLQSQPHSMPLPPQSHPSSIVPDAVAYIHHPQPQALVGVGGGVGGGGGGGGGGVGVGGRDDDVQFLSGVRAALAERRSQTAQSVVQHQHVGQQHVGQHVGQQQQQQHAQFAQAQSQLQSHAQSGQSQSQSQSQTQQPSDARPALRGPTPRGLRPRLSLSSLQMQMPPHLMPNGALAVPQGHAYQPAPPPAGVPVPVSMPMARSRWPASVAYFGEGAGGGGGGGGSSAGASGDGGRKRAWSDMDRAG